MPHTECVEYALLQCEKVSCAHLLFGRLGQNNHHCCRCVHSALRLCGWNALHAVHTCLVSQVSIPAMKTFANSTLSENKDMKVPHSVIISICAVTTVAGGDRDFHDLTTTAHVTNVESVEATYAPWPVTMAETDRAPPSVL